jgi:hypothetical protein
MYPAMEKRTLLPEPRAMVSQEVSAFLDSSIPLI